MASRVSHPPDHLFYARCTICNTILAVEIPFRRTLETATVKCGHCGNLSFLTTRPPQGPNLDRHLSLTLQMQSFCDTKEFNKGSSSSSSSSSSTSSDQALSPLTPFVAKPPEKKQRLPSAYNRFMRDEIQRIKAANPEIPHREAFSAAAKNWAKYIPNSPTSLTSGGKTIHGLGFGEMK
ncbi:PREDICTED: LOW QUALITY PROTEIN: protein CRABS CLAW [Tarenaya hassleriana]|uniref:LOW QUALITY PROTEIN: protein CRABS CLAW n=1 Tax=Tarenaya hassleriana TaxID=28532 RepID=UPI00053C20E6|nr:PREDICTED: LOW QUALITY PROTEIN: protein CRABS CLAW [Tarenaya hassleriana]